MARKNYQKQDEMFPEGGAKPKGKPKSDAGDLGLNNAIDAAEGGQADSDPSLEAPEIQPTGDFPSIKDAYADMSQPPPAPLVEHLSLNHSSSPPRAAFRVKPREGSGFHLWMFNLPYGTAMEGEAFTYPIIASLRDSLLKECLQLVPKRFEIRLTYDAADRYSLLEVPADPAQTVKGENTRQSLLRLIERAEAGWVVGEKMAGIWGATPAAQAFPVKWPPQSLPELADLVYREKLVRDMGYPILQRFRKKIG